MKKHSIVIYNSYNQIFFQKEYVRIGCISNALNRFRHLNIPLKATVRIYLPTVDLITVYKDINKKGVTFRENERKTND